VSYASSPTLALAAAQGDRAADRPQHGVAVLDAADRLVLSSGQQPCCAVAVPIRGGPVTAGKTGHRRQAQRHRRHLRRRVLLSGEQCLRRPRGRLLVVTPAGVDIGEAEQ